MNYNDGLLAKAQREISTAVRTAAQHAAMVARDETYKENDDIITDWQFVATLDDRTSIECQSLDGQIFPLGEGPRPPIHPNCRSTTIPVLDKAFAGLQEGATRIAKGPDGTEIVPADMTYHEWLKTQPDDFQNVALGKTRAALLRSGKLTAERFSQLNLGRDFRPRTLDEMRGLDDKNMKRAFKLAENAR
jgi:SPP1 gp7 family putative phage head morphogenesis protein